MTHERLVTAGYRTRARTRAKGTINILVRSMHVSSAQSAHHCLNKSPVNPRTPRRMTSYKSVECRRRCTIVAPHTRSRGGRVGTRCAHQPESSNRVSRDDALTGDGRVLGSVLRPWPSSSRISLIFGCSRARLESNRAPDRAATPDCCRRRHTRRPDRSLQPRPVRPLTLP